MMVVAIAGLLTKGEERERLIDRYANSMSE